MSIAQQLNRSVRPLIRFQRLVNAKNHGLPPAQAKKHDIGRMKQLPSRPEIRSHRGISPHCSVAVASPTPLRMATPARFNDHLAAGREAQSHRGFSPHCKIAVTSPTPPLRARPHRLKCASIPLSRFNPSDLATYGQHRLRARFLGGGIVLGSCAAAAILTKASFQE